MVTSKQFVEIRSGNRRNCACFFLRNQREMHRSSTSRQRVASRQDFAALQMFGNKTPDQTVLADALFRSEPLEWIGQNAGQLNCRFHQLSVSHFGVWFFVFPLSTGQLPQTGEADDADPVTAIFRFFDAR